MAERYETYHHSGRNSYIDEREALNTYAPVGNRRAFRPLWYTTSTTEYGAGLTFTGWSRASGAASPAPFRSVASVVSRGYRDDGGDWVVRQCRRKPVCLTTHNLQGWRNNYLDLG